MKNLTKYLLLLLISLGTILFFVFSAEKAVAQQDCQNLRGKCLFKCSSGNTTDSLECSSRSPNLLCCLPNPLTPTQPPTPTPAQIVAPTPTPIPAQTKTQCSGPCRDDVSGCNADEREVSGTFCENRGEVCCVALPTSTPIPAPRLTWQLIDSCAVPTSPPAATQAPTPTPNLFTCANQTGPFAGNYQCRNILNGSVQCDSGFGSFSTPGSFTGTSCSTGQGCCKQGPTQSINLFACANQETGGFAGTYTCAPFVNGFSQCPSGFSEFTPNSTTFTGISCSSNQRCCKKDPIPTPTPIITQAASANCLVGDINRDFRCSANNPDPSKCNPFFNPGIITSPCGTDRCWECKVPTPTPIPTSQCGINDCGGPGACGTLSVCTQVLTNPRKDCTCQLISSLTPTTPPSPTVNPGLPAPDAVLLNLAVKINGIPVSGKNPRTLTRPVTVIVQSQKKEITKTGGIKLSASDLLFKTDPIIPINLGTGVPVNTPINLVIKSDFFVGFLPNITLQSGQNSLSSTPLLQVGIDEDGNEDAVSYFHKLVSCFGNKVCSNKNAADLNDDGKVDGNDFNFFVRSLAIIEGLIDKNALTKPIPTLTPTLIPLPTGGPTPTPKP